MKVSSLALWYVPRNNDDADNPKSVEAHFNLWKLPAGSFWFRSRQLFSRYLDIGLRLHNANKIESVKLYVPFILYQNDLKDLGGYLSNANLLCAVFNDNLTIKTGKSDYYEVSKSDGTPDFTIYKLATNSFILDHETEAGATVITINLNYTESNDLYIRFRILGGFAKSLSFIDKPPNSVFQSAFYRTDTIDLRVNEIRVLENKFVEKMENGGTIFQFSKLHFFFICSSREEWYFSQLPYANCRILENEKWRSYKENINLPFWNKAINYVVKIFGKEPKLVPVMAYHWKTVQKDKPITDFNILIKTKFEQSDLITIFIYLLIVIGLALLTEIWGADIERWRHPETIQEKRETQQERKIKPNDTLKSTKFTHP